MIYRGFLRLILFTLVTMSFFLLAGGHLHVMWQPLELLMVVGIYAVAMMGMKIKIHPFDTSPENIRKVQNAGLAGLAASLVVPLVLGLIHASAYLTAGVEKIGMLVAASFVGFIYAVSLYFCFFSGIDSLGEEAVVESSHAKKLKAVAVPLFAGIGALASVTLFAIMLVVIFEAPSEPKYTAAQMKAIDKALLAAEPTILSFECERGERLSYEARQAIEDEVKAKALASVKED